MIKIGDTLEGSVNINIGKSAYLVSPNLPKNIYISKNKTNKALHLDTVKVKVVEGNGRALEGEVIEITNRFRVEFVGVIKLSEKYAFFIPDSNKITVDFFIPLSKIKGALDGQKVVVKMLDWKDDAKNPNGEVVKVLGYVGEHETEIHSILEEYSLPYEFSEDVIAESEAISAIISDDEIAKRRDMRDVLTFTIDPVDAKDFDDALSVEWVNGEIFVGIHIADVSHYLRPDTDLDKEAFARGTSIYLVDRVVPMLPERLSNGLCSLRPNEDKLCFSAVFKLDNNGHVLEEWFGKTIINSNHRYSYEEAQDIIEGKLSFGNDIETIKLEQEINVLNKLAKSMRKHRLSKGSISFDKHEVKFKLNENNHPTDLIFKYSKDSNKLIEEFMLLANRRVAAFINAKGLPSVNRAHDKPDEEKLQQLKEFIKQFNYDINIDSPEEITVSLNKLLEDVKGTAEANMIENLVVRSMKKANYMTKNIGHYGLGFKDYLHFTSPIRRYPDVLVHRLMYLYLNNKTNVKIEKLEGKCIHLSERERRAQKAERDSIKYMQTLYMSDKIGKIYKGIISSVTEYGMFVLITENFCEGLIRLTDIGLDTYMADVKSHSVKGYNTGEVIRLGDEVSIVVKSVDLERKNINLSLIRL